MQAFGGEDGVDGIGELAVPVADQEATRADPLAQVHHQVTSGLGSSGRSQMSGHTENRDSAGPRFHHTQDVESAQPDGVQGDEVGGQQPRRRGAQGSPPAEVCSPWWRPEAGSGQDPVKGARSQAVSQPGEFPLDPAVAPGRILLSQAQHQITNLVTDRWASRPVRIRPLFVTRRRCQASSVAGVTI